MNTKTKNLILSLLVVIIASSIPAIIFCKWKEAIIFVMCHTIIRPQFEKEYHNIIPKVCREITGVVFFFGSTFILPFEFSLFSAIPINYLIGWIGCVKATSDYYENKCLKLQETYCNEKESLLLKCRNANLSERDTKLAIMYFYERKTPKEIWLWQCEQYKHDAVEWQTIYQTLWRIKKKLKL